MVINVSFMVGCLLVDYVKLSCNAWELHCSDIYQSAKHQLSHWHFISRTTPSKHRAKDSCPAKFGIFRDFTFFGSTKQTNLSSSKGDNSICDVYISLSVDTLKPTHFSCISCIKKSRQWFSKLQPIKDKGGCCWYHSMLA